MQISCVVGCDEDVGHGVVSSSVHEACKRSKVRRMMLNHVKGNGKFRKISTDRLTLAEAEADLQFLNESADCREKHPKRWFQGWAVFNVADILKKHEFRVIGSVLRDHPRCPDNRYHADIILPEDSVKGQNWVEYVSDLTNDKELWTWKSRPTGICTHLKGSCNHP